MRISWTLLNAWRRKDYSTVEAMILGLPTWKSKEMQKGIDVHEYIARNKIKVMDFFSSSTRFEGDGQNKFTVDIDGDTLVGIIDVYDPEVGFLADFKVSKKSAKEQNQDQLFFYNILLGLSGEKTVDKGYMIQIDPTRAIDDIKVLSYAWYELGNEKKSEDVYFWVRRSVEEIKKYFWEELEVRL